MTRLTRYLLACLLLVPSVALAQWTPLEIPNIRFLISPAHCTHNWQEISAAQNQADTAGDTVGIVDECASGLFVESLSGALPVLGNDATHGGYFSFDSVALGGNKLLVVKNARKLFRYCWIDRDFWFYVRVKFPVALAASNEVIWDGIALSDASSSVGFYLIRTSTEALSVGLTNGSGTLQFGTDQAMTSTAGDIDDTNVHDILVRVTPGTNASKIYLDGVEVAQATVGSAAAAGTDATGDGVIGRRSNSSANPGNCYVFLMASGPGDISSDDRTALYAYKPQLNPTGALTKWGATTDERSHVIFHHDFTDADNLRQNNGTTAITAADQPVGYSFNLKTAPSGCTYNRDFSQSTSAKCPLWKTSQVNGLPAPLWAGEAADVVGGDFTGENNLALPSGVAVNTGASTLIIVYRQTRTESGSHLISSSGGYVVATGSTYQSGARGDLVYHGSTAEAAQSPVADDPEGVNLAVVLTAGTYARVGVNGAWGDPIDEYSAINLVNLGRPKNPPAEGVDPWDMAGNLCEIQAYNRLLTQSEIDSELAILAAKYGVTGVEYPGSGGAPGNPRIGLGIGIGLGAVERKTPAQKFLAAARLQADEFQLAP